MSKTIITTLDITRSNTKFQLRLRNFQTPNPPGRGPQWRLFLFLTAITMMRLVIDPRPGYIDVVKYLDKLKHDLYKNTLQARA